MQYQVKPLGSECSATGERLEPGSVCHSVLVRDGDDFVRRDFSAEGWSGPPEGTIGHWTSRVPVPDAKPRTLDPDEMMQFLENLDEEGDPAREPLRYVLALLLVRKRRLEFEESHVDEVGDEIQAFVGTRGEGRFEIRNPELGDEEVEALQQELLARIEAGFRD